MRPPERFCPCSIARATLSAVEAVLAALRDRLQRRGERGLPETAPDRRGFAARHEDRRPSPDPRESSALSRRDRLRGCSPSREAVARERHRGRDDGLPGELSAAAVRQREARDGARNAGGERAPRSRGGAPGPPSAACRLNMSRRAARGARSRKSMVEDPALRRRGRSRSRRRRCCPPPARSRPGRRRRPRPRRSRFRPASGSRSRRGRPSPPRRRRRRRAPGDAPSELAADGRARAAIQQEEGGAQAHGRAILSASKIPRREIRSASCPSRASRSSCASTSTCRSKTAASRTRRASCETLPTIRHALERGARVICASHLGKPKGKPNPEVLARSRRRRRFAEALGRPVRFVSDCVGPEAGRPRPASLAAGRGAAAREPPVPRGRGGQRSGVRPGARGARRRSTWTTPSARRTAPTPRSSACPRAHGGQGSGPPDGEGGPRALEAPRARPALRGDPRRRQDLGQDRHAAGPGEVARTCCSIGGGMANHFVRALGLSVGKSLLEEDKVPVAREILDICKKEGKTIALPSDFVVAASPDDGAGARTVGIDKIPADRMALDVGREDDRAVRPAARAARGRSSGTARWASSRSRRSTAGRWRSPRCIAETDGLHGRRRRRERRRGARGRSRGEVHARLDGRRRLAGVPARAERCRGSKRSAREALRRQLEDEQDARRGAGVRARSSPRGSASAPPSVELVGRAAFHGARCGARPRRDAGRSRRRTSAAEAAGAFTGEVSARMLADAGCRYVIVGHSERRRIFGEDGPLCSPASSRASREGGLDADLLSGRDRGGAPRGLTAAGPGAPGGDALGQDPAAAPLVVAYEPVWAIGTGQAATPDDAAAAREHLREAAARPAETCACSTAARSRRKTPRNLLEPPAWTGS